MTNKEPWLAVNLSKILPGLGQIYSGDKRKGYTIIFFYFFLLITGYGLIFSISGSIVLGLISILCFFGSFYMESFRCL
jgi:signal peptidase I